MLAVSFCLSFVEDWLLAYLDEVMDLRVVSLAMDDALEQLDQVQVQWPMVVSYTEMVAHTDDTDTVN